MVEYVGATGDESLLDERTPYLESEQPFEPLPAGKHGMGFDPLRSSREDTVYRHCLKAIDLVLDRRMGAHGLPLIGTGDWNDGLDEIGSQGRGESVWLGFFLVYILDRMVPDRRDGGRAASGRTITAGGSWHLKEAIERTWRGDRYLRAIHDDGTEIGVKGSGVWEIDALTAAWAVMSGINPERGRIVFETALRILEKETTILLGWPPLREDTKPYLGRSSGYPEGVRENGMYCHGVQWLVGAARLLAERCDARGPARRGPPLPRDGLSALAEDLGDPPRRARRGRDLRRPAEPAGGRHGDDLRPRPDDLERLHRRRRLDVPPGPRRGARASAWSAARWSPRPTSRRRPN